MKLAIIVFYSVAAVLLMGLSFTLLKSISLSLDELFVIIVKVVMSLAGILVGFCVIGMLFLMMNGL